MADDEFHYASGFGNEFVDRGGGGRAARRAATRRSGPARPVRRADQRHRVHPAARGQPRTWVYRILPIAKHPPSRRIDNGGCEGTPFDELEPDPNRLRWDPLPLPLPIGRRTSSTASHARPATATVRTRDGMAVHLYAANRSMIDRYFVDADGELLFVPEYGALILHTELGPLRVDPGEIAVVPAGHPVPRRAPEADDGYAVARGYVCENFGAALHPARARPDRRQRPGQRAGLPAARTPRSRSATTKSRW